MLCSVYALSVCDTKFETHRRMLPSNSTVDAAAVSNMPTKGAGTDALSDHNLVESGQFMLELPNLLCPTGSTAQPYNS
jgi:hypothetical protein